MSDERVHVAADLGDWAYVLSPKAIKLWRVLQEYDDGAVWPTLDVVVADSGLSKTGVRAAVAELHEHGFLDWEVENV